MARATRGGPALGHRARGEVEEPAHVRHRAGCHHDLHHVGAPRAHVGVEAVEVVGSAGEVVEGDHEALARPWRPGPRRSGLRCSTSTYSNPRLHASSSISLRSGWASLAFPPSETARQVKSRGLSAGPEQGEQVEVAHEVAADLEEVRVRTHVDHAVDEGRRVVLRQGHADPGHDVSGSGLLHDARQQKSLFRFPEEAFVGRLRSPGTLTATRGRPQREKPAAYVWKRW